MGWYDKDARLVNITSGGTFGIHEPKRIFGVHLDAFGYIRGEQAEPRTESRAERTLLTMSGTRLKNFHERYLKNYRPYKVMLNVDGINYYTKTYVKTDTDQTGETEFGQKN